jgi:penicillin-binding protein A
MQDLKHITRRRRFNPFSRKKNSSNLFTPPEKPEKERKGLRLVLLVLAVLLAMYPLVGMLVSSPGAVPKDIVRKPSTPAYKSLDSYQAFKLAVESLSASGIPVNSNATQTDGSTLVYSFNDEVQARVRSVMEKNRVPYAAFIAIEPKTGRILALAGYSAIQPDWEKRCFYNLYPMASLFKIVTAAAALEEKKVSPETKMAFRGKLTSENPKYWQVGPRGRGGTLMDLSMAMGKSVNPVFGRLAGDVVGRDSLMTYVDRFGFNQPLIPGVPLPPSAAATPQSIRDLELMGAGLVHEVKISPLHAVMMMAAIANDGVMLVPSMLKEVKSGTGEVIAPPRGEVLRRLVTPETAGQLSRMLATTVKSGTSRKIFHDRRGRPLLASIPVAAKTGSINGDDPPGHYSWFTAYAPIDDPQIALAALVVNQDKWKIKASYLGEQALEAFFK